MDKLGLMSERIITSRLLEYYDFYPNVKGEPQDFTQPICKLCKTCAAAKAMQTPHLFAHMQILRPSKAAKLSRASTASSTGAVSKNTPRHVDTLWAF